MSTLYCYLKFRNDTKITLNLFYYLQSCPEKKECFLVTFVALCNIVDFRVSRQLIEDCRGYKSVLMASINLEDMPSRNVYDRSYERKL